MSSFSKKLERLSSEWVEKGHITPQQRQLILNHPLSSPVPWSQRILPVLSALLVGLGLIALAAYNWDIFPKEIKLSLGLLPWMVVVGFLLGAEFRNRPLPLEPGGILGLLTVMLALGIISQVYQVQGDLQDYFFGVLLISLPLTVVLRSWTAGVVWIILLTAIHLMNLGTSREESWTLVLYLLVPLLGYLRIREKKTSRLLYFTGAVGLSLSFLAAARPEELSLILGLLLALGVLWSGLGGWKLPSLGLAPLGGLGAGLILSLLLLGGMGWFWSEIGSPPGGLFASFQSLAFWAQMGSVLVLLGGLGSWIVAVIHRSTRSWLVPLALVFLLVLVLRDQGVLVLPPLVWVLSANTLVLLQALMWIFDPQKREGRIFGGTALLLAVVNQRFFDGDFSFLIKGLVLIGSGVFLLILHQRRKKASPKEGT